MLEALLASMPTVFVEEARRSRNLFIVGGCTPYVAQANVVELYSPPRVTAELGRQAVRASARAWHRAQRLVFSVVGMGASMAA